MSEVLGQSSGLKETLWNFSRFKDEERRLALKQNPHFYPRLPTSPEAYGSKFRTAPISENYQHEKISVLTDNPGPMGRVYLKTARIQRTFVDVWMPKNALIFRGSCLSALSFSQCMISSQTSMERSRVKVSSERPLATLPTYGTLRRIGVGKLK